MLLDYNSLLLAIGFSGACLCLTMFGSWLSAPRERFLLTWSVGTLLVVVHVVAYDRYVDAPTPLAGVIALAPILVGLAFIFGAAYQFRTHSAPFTRIGLAAVAALAIVLPPMAVGYDGISFVLHNLAAFALLSMAAREYWRCRHEMFAPVVGLVVLYAICGLSFALCAIVLLADFSPVLGHAPENWAEDINVVASIIGVSGIGALSLALNQSRIAGGHHRESVTDPLTGLLNRRALFSRHAARPLNPSTAVVLFDLDHFKAVNDAHGHATGDEALRIFASVLSAAVGPADTVARLGGEEFVLVLPRTEPERAERIAQTVRTTFAATPIRTPTGVTFGTVSAGIAFGTAEGVSFDRVLGQADGALYSAKRDGRNRIGRINRKLVR
ncbi:MAG: diguanylate cyclase [Rhizobiaceae bacterium]